MFSICNHTPRRQPHKGLYFFGNAALWKPIKGLVLFSNIVLRQNHNRFDSLSNKALRLSGSVVFSNTAHRQRQKGLVFFSNTALWQSHKGLTFFSNTALHQPNKGSVFFIGIAYSTSRFNGDYSHLGSVHVRWNDLVGVALGVASCTPPPLASTSLIRLLRLVCIGWSPGPDLVILMFYLR